MGEQCTQASFLDGMPAKLRSTNKSSICERCEASGLSPKSKETAKRPSPKIAVRREEAKVRNFKDGLTAQLYLQRGSFWDAIREVREKRRIVAARRLPPSGPGINGLIFPGFASDEDRGFLRLYDEWVEDIERIEDRCIPARFRDSAEWKSFISACLLFDPPEDRLSEFTEHGDPRYLDYTQSGGKGERAPLRAVAPLRLLVANEKELEDTHVWLLDRLLEELGKRYLEPLGLSVETMVKEIFHSTNLREQYQEKKRGLPRHWHISVESGIVSEDVRKAFLLIPDSQKARSTGGRPSRNPVIALQCAVLYDRRNPVEENGGKRWTFASLAERYGLPTDEVDEYIKVGRRMLSQAERE